MKTISENALIQRVNCRIDNRVRRCPYDSRDFHELGRFYAVNDRNCIVDKDIDLEALARDVGALRPDEVLAD